MNETEAVRLLAILKAAYPRQPIRPETLQLYAKVLADLDGEAVKAAVDRLLCSSRFFPTIAEIREEATKSALEGLPEPETAWSFVLSAVQKVGAYGSPDFGDEALNDAVDAVGWRTICLDENVMSTRARFIDAYRVCLDRKRRKAQLGPHAGAPNRLGAKLKLRLKDRNDVS